VCSSDLLEVAALASEPFAPALLAPACALSELDTVMAIDEAVQAQLLREHDAGGFAFRHDLVQQAIDSALAPERRRLVHRRLALAAEATGATPASIALHHEASGEPARAVPFRLRAGDEARRLHALQEAVDHWQQGLADRPQLAQSIDLRWRLMQVTHAMERKAEALAHCAALLELVAAEGVERPLRVRAVSEAALRLAQWGLADQALAELDKLPPGLPPPAQLQVAGARAWALLFLGRTEAAQDLVRDALRGADVSDLQRARALFQLGSNETVSGRHGAAVQHMETAIALQRGAPEGTAADLIAMTSSYGTVLYQLGRFQEAGDQLEETAAVARSIGHKPIEKRALFNLNCVRLAQLRPDAALGAAQQVRTLLEGETDLEYSAMLRGRFVETHAMDGQFGAAYAEATQAVPEILASGRRPYTMVAVAMYLSEFLACLGDRTTLQPLLEAVDGLDAADPRLIAGVGLVSVEMWAARGQAAMLEGDLDAAARALRRVGETTAIEGIRQRHRAQIAQAEWAVCSGAIGGSADAVLEPGDITPADGLRVRAWAVQVRASLTAGTLQRADLDRAREALRAQPPQAVPAMSALHLYRALTQAAAVLRPAWAAALHAEASAHVQRLAASLADWPVVQAAFLSRWAP
jgi:tetratricopeptide (TPR) repeat protein